MTTPTLTSPPTAPTRSDPTTFRSRGDAFLSWFATAWTELSAMIAWIASTASDIAGYASSASSSAGTATTQAGNASTSAGTATTQAGIATTQAGLADASAVAAAASAASAAAIANAFIGTSTTAWTPVVESKAFTTQAGELYTTGIYVTVVSAAAPTAYGWGQVTSYAGTTLTVDVQLAAGSGSHTDWNISLSGVRGATGATGAAGATCTGGSLTTGLNEARGSVAMHATTMDLWAQPNIIDGTSSAATVTAIVNAPQAGARRVFYPVAASIITNGATFAVDGAANHTAAAGDKWEFEAITTSTYKVHVTKKDGTAVALAGSFTTLSAGSAVDITPSLGTWTPTFIGLTVVNGSGGATYSGTYTKIGRMFYWTIKITVTGSCTTAATAGSTYVSNAPFTFGTDGIASASNSDSANYGTACTTAGAANITVPSWSAVNRNVYITGVSIT